LLQTYYISWLNYLEKYLSNNYCENIDIKINKCPKQLIITYLKKKVNRYNNKN